MACLSMYGTAEGYATFWCIANRLVGVDNSGVLNNAFLTDTLRNFLTSGVRPNVGMILYNTTDGSHGPVTAVTEHTITATLTGGTENDWDNGDAYLIVTIDAAERAIIEYYLTIVASDINAARAASGACDCTLQSWALVLLEKLAYIEAVAMHNCPCGTAKISDEMKRVYLEWVTNQLELIRVGKLELCSGATGAEFPSLDWAEQGVTEFDEALIIYNDSLRP